MIIIAKLTSVYLLCGWGRMPQRDAWAIVEAFCPSHTDGSRSGGQSTGPRPPGATKRSHRTQVDDAS